MNALPWLLLLLLSPAALRAETKPPAPAAAPAAAPKEGAEAPWIAAFDLNGDPRNLDRLLGKKGARGAVVSFWASWCKPCLKELALLSAGRERLAAEGVELFLVNLLDEPAVAKAVVEEKRLSGATVVRDATGAIAEKVGVAAPGQARPDALKLPLTLVVAARGKTIKKVFAGDQVSETIVDDALRLLADEPRRGL